MVAKRKAKPSPKPVQKTATTAKRKVAGKSGSKSRLAANARSATRSKPAPALHDVRFPGESRQYRNARDRLLMAEIELRRHVEEVAALRRKLPLGGEVPEDYVFVEADAAGATRQIKLSELFERDGASLVIYGFMYGPNAARPCPMCTSMLDALDGNSPHATQRINLAVVARSPIGRIQEFARDRGWRNLRLLSSSGNSFNRDYHAEAEDGSQLPALNVFVRHDGRIYHSFSTELLFAPTEPGQNGRHVDAIWPLWNLLDFTPEGRGKDWYPKLSYAA